MSQPLKDHFVRAISHAYLTGFMHNGIGPEEKEAQSLGRRTKLRKYLAEQGIDVLDRDIAEIITEFQYEALEDYK